jgi:hypothetical protein
VYPLYNEHGLCLYQTRKLYEDDPIKSKWITKKDPVNLQYTFIEGADNSICTITEDINSSIKLTSYTDTYPLLGSNMTKSQLLYLSTYYTKYIIWLDNDNNQVLSNVRDIKSRLELLGYKVHPVTIKQDPKNIPYSQLDSIMGDIVDGIRTT